MKKIKYLKIGVFFDADKEISDHQIRLFDFCLTNQKIHIPLIININENNNKNNFNYLVNRMRLNSTLIRLIHFIEKKYSYITRLNKKKKVLNKIKSILSINIKKDYITNKLLFNDNELKEIKKLKLDLIISNQHYLNLDKLVNHTKYGVWSICYNKYYNSNSFPYGFWESLNNKATTCINLINVNKKMNTIIETGKYNTQRYWLLNNEFVKEKSINIIIKYIEILLQNKNINKKFNIRLMKFKKPNSNELIKYILIKYISAIYRRIIKFFHLENLKNKNIWKLHMKDTINKINNFKNYKTIEPKNNEFWADPFIFNYENIDYVFFENYSHYNKKGKISVGIIKNDNIVNIKDALNLPYHLSYPFIYKEKNKIFMIPETFEKKRVEVWLSIKFPTIWKLYSTAFVGEYCVDTTIFKDKKGNKWLFTNKSFDKFKDFSSELYIYKIKDLKLKKILPHSLNPLINNSSNARNAGNIFINRYNQIIRPSQVNEYGKYGHSLRFNKIIKLSINDYREQKLNIYNPNINKNYSGSHHFSSNNSKTIIDVLHKFR